MMGRFASVALLLFAATYGCLTGRSVCLTLTSPLQINSPFGFAFVAGFTSSSYSVTTPSNAFSRVKGGTLTRSPGTTNAQRRGGFRASGGWTQVDCDISTAIGARLGGGDGDDRDPNFPAPSASPPSPPFVPGLVFAVTLALSSLGTPTTTNIKAPSVAPTTTTTGNTESVFTNDYADPFHPSCERHIRVSDDGKTFHYSGTAVGPKDDPVRRGCTAAEVRQFGLRRGSFDGVILDGGERISAGDGVHEGVWEPAKSAGTSLGYEDLDGIRWKDGNKWTVLPKKL